MKSQITGKMWHGITNEAGNRNKTRHRVTVSERAEGKVGM